MPLRGIRSSVLSMIKKVTVNGISKTVLRLLQESHPQNKPLITEVIIPDNPAHSIKYRSSIFKRLNAAANRRAALKRSEIHGHLGLHAEERRGLLTSFKKSSSDFQSLITSALP